MKSVVRWVGVIVIGAISGLFFFTLALLLFKVAVYLATGLSGGGGFP